MRECGHALSRKVMKKFALFGLVTLLFVAAISGAAFAAARSNAKAAAADSAINIGVVEIEEVVQSHPGLKKARQDVANLSRQKENEAKTAADKEPDQAKKAQIVNQKRMELVQGEQRIMEPIYKDCQQAVRDVATRMKLTHVFMKTVVLIGGTDITQDVIQQLSRKK